MAGYLEANGGDDDKILFWGGGACTSVKCWPHESFYTVLSRLALAIGVPGDTIERAFKSKHRRNPRQGRIVGLETLSLVNLRFATERLGVSWKVLESMFLRAAPIDQGDGFAPYLRFCPVCMGARRHFVFFQREQLLRCPFHRAVLLSRCSACGHHAEYTWGAGLFLQPFCCPACKVPWAGARMRQSFFDLLTPNRQSVLQQYAHKQAKTESSFARNIDCPGFLLTHPKGTWHDYLWQEQPPLLERRASEVNWSLENGFVQVRTLLGRKGERQEVGEYEVRELVQCLKSILRHVRKSWQLRMRFDDLVVPRQSAEKKRIYQLFYESLVISVDAHTPAQAPDRLERVVIAWLVRHAEAEDARGWPRSARAWYTAHSFASHVLDRLSLCGETATWSSDVEHAIILKYVMAKDRPIWPLELIYENDRRSYRLLRQQRFLSQLLYDAPCNLVLS